MTSVDVLFAPLLQAVRCHYGANPRQVSGVTGKWDQLVKKAALTRYSESDE
jgi:hypothetical protein